MYLRTNYLSWKYIKIIDSVIKIIHSCLITLYKDFKIRKNITGIKTFIVIIITKPWSNRDTDMQTL